MDLNKIMYQFIILFVQLVQQLQLLFHITLSTELSSIFPILNTGT